MIIIVEGIDRVGKTTLCNKLSTELNIPVYKHSQKVMDYSLMDNMNETDKMIHMLDVCKLTNASLIFDRFHFSDFAYGIIDRHYDKKTAKENLILLDKTLHDMNAILILVFPTDISSSSKQHGKDLTPYSELIHYAHEISNMKMYICNYHRIDDVVKKIKEMNI